jgi:hypothetical protein
VGLDAEVGVRGGESAEGGEERASARNCEAWSENWVDEVVWGREGSDVGDELLGSGDGGLGGGFYVSFGRVAIHVTFLIVNSVRTVVVALWRDTT